MNKITSLEKDIEKIHINKEDLLSCVLEYSKVFQKELNELDIRYFDELFGNQLFVDMSCSCVKEAIVLAMNALVLNKNVKFKNLVNYYVNKGEEAEALLRMTDSNAKQDIAKEFFFELKKEFFSRTCSQNKSLSEVTKLDVSFIDERKKIYIGTISP